MKNNGHLLKEQLLKWQTNLGQEKILQFQSNISGKKKLLSKHTRPQTKKTKAKTLNYLKAIYFKMH
jgi:hypothetical protein